MKTSRLLLTAMLLIFVIGIGVAATKFVKKSPPSQTRDNGMVWKPKQHPLNLTTKNIEVNVTNLSDKSDWVVSAVPLKSNETPSAVIGIAHWGEAGRRGKQILERIIRIDEYTGDLASLASGNINLDGQKIADDSSQTLIVYLQIAPNTNVRLVQGDKTTDLLTASFNPTQQSATVRNNQPFILPVNNRGDLLLNLQAARLTQTLQNAGYSITPREGANKQ